MFFFGRWRAKACKPGEWEQGGEPCRTCIALMWECSNPDSFWRAYCDALPPVPTSPNWWTDEEREELQSDAGFDHAKEYRQFTDKLYSIVFPRIEETHPEYFPPGKFSRDDFEKGFLHIWGRAFAANANDPEKPDRRVGAANFFRSGL